MLYDRPYMRQESAPAAPKSSMVTRLLIVTIGVTVVVQLIAVLFPDVSAQLVAFIYDQLAISGQSFAELKLWTLVTYGFFHSADVMSFFFIPVPYAHLVFNMLMLYVLGRQIEPVLGAKRFLALYFAGIIGGGLVYAILHFNSPGNAIGASAAISALFAFFARINPDARMMIIPIPVPIRMKWLFYGAVLVTLFGVSTELSQTHQGGIAHTAHLGGLLVGLAFHHYVYKNNSIPFLNPNNTSGSNRASAEPPAWFKRRPKTTQKLNYSVNRSSREELQAEVDRILDKINSQGFGALSENEKDTLDRAKEILSK